MVENPSYLPRLGSMIALENQNVADKEDEELTPNMERAKDQMEYYFNNLNLERDNFLLKKYQETNNKIPVDVFMTFNQMIKLEISPDDVLFACSKSKYLNVDFDNKTISRKETFKKDRYRKDRTLRITGIPLDFSTKDLDEVFEKFNPVWIVPQSRFDENGEKIFNGIALIEFKTDEQLEIAVKGIKELVGVQLETEIFSDFEARIKEMKKNKQ